MKGISILTGAVIALGLGGAPAAFANDDLDEVTMEMVFDDVDEIGGATLSLDEEELARDVRGEDGSERDGASDDGSRDRREEGDGFSEDGRVADLTDEELGVEHDEALEGGLEDHDVEEELEHELDGEMDGEGEEGLGEDVADGSEIDEEMSDDEIASESDVESIDDVLEDDIPEEDGDLV